MSGGAGERLIRPCDGSSEASTDTYYSGGRGGGSDGNGDDGGDGGGGDDGDVCHLTTRVCVPNFSPRIMRVAWAPAVWSGGGYWLR